MLTEILLFVVCIILLLYYISNDRCQKFPPGPPWRPFIGNGPELRKLAKEYGGQHLAFTELARRYDTEVVGLQLGKERVICVCSYATVRQVLTSDDYQGRPDNFFMKLRTMGTRKGITVTDGDLWKEQRAFLVSHLRALGFGTTLMEHMIKEEIKQTITLIEKNVEMVDLSATLAPSILNILWTLTSGKNVKGNNRIERLLQLLRQRTRAFDMSGGTLNNYPWLRFVAPEKSGYNLMKTINIEVRNLIMETINDHKKSWTDERCDDFIYSFLTEMKKREGKRSYFSEEQLVMVCLDIFIAGSATTSNTIDTALLAMILYPEVQEKVHQSLDSAFKKDEDVSYCDKERVPYVNAVLLECQRFFPVVPVIGPRRVLRTTHLDEYLIPKETTVLLNLHSVHHDQNYWKDPAVFRPERFLDENSNLICQDRVLTFGLGKRRCLGDALARACLFLFFVEILRKYNIEYTGSTKPTGKQTPGMIMSPEHYKAKFSLRF
nr:cytochrome P450 CYP305F1 [Dendroctonus valens]